MKRFRFLFPAMLLLASSALSLFAADEDYLTYDKFIAAVEAGSIKSVTLDRYSTISGIYLVNGAEHPFSTYGNAGSANDVLLNRLLKQNSVKITVAERKDRNPFVQGSIFAVIMLLVPVVTLFLVFRINAKLNRFPNPLRSDELNH